MRLRQMDSCPNCGEPLVLRNMRSFSTLFLKRHVLRCQVCRFTAVGRRATASALPIRVRNPLLRRVRDALLGFTVRARSREQGGHYLVLAQEARMSAKRFEGTEHPALVALAESWEKLARKARDHPRPAVMARAHRASKAARKYGQLLGMAFVIMIGAAATLWFAVDGDSTAVNASEAEVTPRTNALVQWRSEANAPRRFEQVATVIHPVVLTVIVSLPLQEVQISDPPMASKSLPVTRNQATKRPTKSAPPSRTRRTRSASTE